MSASFAKRGLFAASAMACATGGFAMRPSFLGDVDQEEQLAILAEIQARDAQPGSASSAVALRRAEFEGEEEARAASLLDQEAAERAFGEEPAWVSEARRAQDELEGKEGKQEEGENDCFAWFSRREVCLPVPAPVSDAPASDGPASDGADAPKGANASKGGKVGKRGADIKGADAQVDVPAIKGGKAGMGKGKSGAKAADKAADKGTRKKAGDRGTSAKKRPAAARAADDEQQLTNNPGKKQRTKAKASADESEQPAASGPSSSSSSSGSAMRRDGPPTAAPLRHERMVAKVKQEMVNPTSQQASEETVRILEGVRDALTRSGFFDWGKGEGERRLLYRSIAYKAAHPDKHSLEGPEKLKSYQHAFQWLLGQIDNFLYLLKPE